MASNLTQAELSALLGAAPSSASFLLGGSAGLSNGQAPGSGDNLASAAAAAARNSNLLNSLLLQRQAEEQQKLQMAQQLAALSGLFNSLPQVDNLSLWLQQQQQLQKLQASAQAGGINPAAVANARLFGLGGSGLGGIGGLGGLGGLGDFSGLGGAAPTNYELLSKLMPPPVTTPTAATTSLSSSLLHENPNLPAFPDRKRKGRTGTFPQKLHTMLSDLEGQEGGTAIASFLPHGRAFAIHKPRDFVKHVMPKYFRMSRFSSFQRQLNLYDFQRITEGPDKVRCNVRQHASNCERAVQHSLLTMVIFLCDRVLTSTSCSCRGGSS